MRHLFVHCLFGLLSVKIVYQVEILIWQDQIMDMGKCTLTLWPCSHHSVFSISLPHHLKLSFLKYKALGQLTMSRLLTAKFTSLLQECLENVNSMSTGVWSRLKFSLFAQCLLSFPWLGYYQFGHTVQCAYNTEIVIVTLFNCN